LAELTRRPDDRRCIAVDSAFWLVDVLRWAFSEDRLVLIIKDIWITPETVEMISGMSAGIA
jgi:hypothetical protein